VTLVHKPSGQEVPDNARPTLLAIRSDMAAFVSHAISRPWLAANPAVRAYLEKEGLVGQLGIVAPKGKPAEQDRVPLVRRLDGSRATGACLVCLPCL